MIRGSIPALVTPFLNGEIDHQALEDLVEWQIQEGSHGLVGVGTTGESPTLSHEEHEEVIETIVKKTRGRVPVIAGAGSNNTKESINLMKFAKKVGADAALVVAPYYNKPNQEGLLLHFKMLNDCCDLPIIVYNIPGRSVIDIEVSTMAKLSKLKNIIGVKDATGDVTRVSDTRQKCGNEFIQVSGEDASALGFNAHGGTGCISVIANVAPRLSADFQNAMLKGDYNKALSLQDKLLPLHRATFLEPSPCPIKYALSKLNKCENEVRAPLVPISQETRSIMDKALAYANLIS
ncbi:MAG: 4-hydroxy-tetrahydrodipicolinate synthase [Rhodobacteraceae bacterium]|nr:MAG: 4-hydroxy-tetrahydrodipicolinate synthase [Paracoccaceae bacterium]